METHLTFDNRGKQLGILVKERLTTDQNLQLKVCASVPLPSTLMHAKGNDFCHHEGDAEARVQKLWRLQSCSEME
jgi:hypothetical protein